MTHEEVPFQLEDGIADAAGRRHRDGVMRPACVADEIAALRDFRVHLWPQRVLDILLPRVIVRLGDLRRLDVGQIQSLSAGDLGRLEDLYRKVNHYGS